MAGRKEKTSVTLSEYDAEIRQLHEYEQAISGYYDKLTEKGVEEDRAWGEFARRYWVKNRNGRATSSGF